MIQRRLPWFTYQFYSLPASGGGRKTAPLVQDLLGPPLDTFYNIYLFEVETDENEAALKKGFLEEICLEVNMKDAWKAESVPWLRRMLDRRELLDAGMALGQCKITDYYAVVAPESQG